MNIDETLELAAREGFEITIYPKRKQDAKEDYIFRVSIKKGKQAVEAFIYKDWVYSFSHVIRNELLEHFYKKKP